MQAQCAQLGALVERQEAELAEAHRANDNMQQCLQEQSELIGAQARDLRATPQAQPTLTDAQIEQHVRAIYGTAATAQEFALARALSGAPSQCAAPSERAQIKRVDLEGGFWIEFERKTSGASGWLLRDKTGKLLSALTLHEVDLVDGALRASLAPAPPVATPGEREPDTDLGAATDGMEILDDLIESIRKHGNYSAEATLTFLGQLRQCLVAAPAPEAQR
jgi:hypothetical protein